MSQVFDSREQESEFQEIYEEVKIPTFSTRHLTENDLRIIFVAGIEFGKKKIRRDFGICSLEKKD